MPSRKRRDIVHRWEGNPIIGVEDLPFRCNDIWNPGVARLNGEYVLLLTVERLDGRKAIYRASGSDGHHFEIELEPVLFPDERAPTAEYERRGLQDARITPVDGSYYVTYNAMSHHGNVLGLARSADLKKFERVGIISQPDTKAGALFPRKIRGKYARLERPPGGCIWVSFSDDLRYWGGSQVVLTPRGGYWDNNRIGAATPPFETEHGWFFVYYGVKETSAGPLFRLGAAFLDLDDPTKEVGRTNVPILSPREAYERIGDIGNVVFSCGGVLEKDGSFRLYYGASYSCICMGTTTLDAIVEACRESVRDF